MFAACATAYPGDLDDLDPDPDERPAPARSRLRRVVVVAAQLLLGLTLGAAIAELAFHLRDDGAFPHVNFYVPDPALGVRLEPGASMRFQLRQNPVSTIHVNNDGYRGPAWPAPASSEILVVGDSQVFGLGVDDDATFSARLATLVDRPVINAGVPTYGPREYLTVAHELLATRKVATVVVVLNFVNDPFELERPNRKRHAVWDGWAVRKETEPASITEFPGRRWLFSRSHAVYALRRWLHERGSAAGPEADDLGLGIDDVIDLGTPSEGGLHDLVVTRQQAHAEVTRTQQDAARSLAGAATRIREIDGELIARRDQLDALIQSEEHAISTRIARSLPGDIISNDSSESGRSTVVTAAMIREATRDRALLLAERLRGEKKQRADNRPAHDLIAAESDLNAERARLREQLATGVVPVPRPASQFRGYIGEFKALCEQLGAELVVVALPIDVQVDRGEWAKYGVHDGPDMGETLVLLADLLADARDLGLRTLDATPALRAAEPGAFLDHDIHMTAKGHAALAEALAAVITAPPAPPPAPPRPGLPPGRSFVPTAAEWATVLQAEITGARELGCSVQREREWLRVLCRRRKWADRFDSLIVREGASPATMALRTADALNLVTPLTVGEDFTARFTWKRGAHDLTVRWPAGPDGVPTFTGAFVAVPVVQAPSRRPLPEAPDAPAIASLCACERARDPRQFCDEAPPPADLRCEPICSDLWADPGLAAACLAAYTTCAEQTACAQNDPLFAPPCPEGQVHAFASNACFTACDEHHPCAAGTCTPWPTGSVCAPA